MMDEYWLGEYIKDVFGMETNEIDDVVSPKLQTMKKNEVQFFESALYRKSTMKKVLENFPPSIRYLRRYLMRNLYPPERGLRNKWRWQKPILKLDIIYTAQIPLNEFLPTNLFKVRKCYNEIAKLIDGKIDNTNVAVIGGPGVGKNGCYIFVTRLEAQKEREIKTRKLNDDNDEQDVDNNDQDDENKQEDEEETVEIAKHIF
ncbi:hypothetical protein O9G_003870 [Rozella allomycis CSF55]|uniref:Uncharacterized protein n=1 Tax=Rozella allomycis (strain CSF55) TaxID=988480 RepID=A0A075B4D3_ROZAC|nr:hypothetical protein O9G_003870 [Rozella allomycis CSF55]|eukprot:EPZ36245.1 hypothetical protein O9G_003870 [Rozella allomycis CSF55]